MLAERLKKLRKDFGWTQVELAKRAGVSQQLITKIESGAVHESRKLPKLAAAFGLTVEQFVTGEVAARPSAAPSPRRSTSDWPFHRLRPADFAWLDPSQISDIEELVEDRIARFKARSGPRRRRKSLSA